MKAKAFQLKVTLRHVRPPIWRRLVVRGDTTLARLHDILQIAMGWTDSHLHLFEAEGKTYGVPDRESDLVEVNEKKVRLAQVLAKEKDRMRYDYDFGDGWEHDIVVEKLLPAVPGRGRYPMVTGGRRACPPEDCGGVPGYYHLVEVFQDPNHPEHEEMMEWSGGEYDPDEFDAREINRAFHGGWALPGTQA